MKEDGGRGEGVGREITQTSCEAQKLDPSPHGDWGLGTRLRWNKIRLHEGRWGQGGRGGQGDNSDLL